METTTPKELAKTLIDVLPNQKVFLVLDFIREMEKEDKRSEEQECFAFDKLVRHTERANRADEYIREIRDYDRV